MATAGGSRRKSHGGKSTDSSFTDVATLLKHFDAQSSDSNQRLVLAASVQPRTPSRWMSGYSCGISCRAACPVIKARDIALSTGPFCCGVYSAINSRRIPRPLQKSTDLLFEYSVPLLVRNARGTPISATKRFTTEKMAAALLSRAPYGRCRRATNITTYRDPREKSNKVQWCRYEPVPAAASLASSRDVEWCLIPFRPRTSRT